jgi:aryl-alcohol dehydrogenase-like predicted oxidoreductase
VNTVPTALNRFRVLGRSGLRVSPLCLGAMTFGTEWGWGAPKEESRRMFDLYIERGGNFIDTANFYTNGTSETWLGEFLAGRRDEIVLATKYTLCMRRGDPNAWGNHRKNLRQSLEASLRRLRTECIDLYWVHIHDGLTPIEETMRVLDDAVRSGKVLHVGISDMPAWLVAQANTLAELRGWSPFTALQIKYNLIDRAAERDLMPMARAFKIAVTPWSPLESGHLTGKYVKGDAAKTEGRVKGEAIPERFKTIAREVVKLAGEIGKSPAQVALQWLLRQPGVTSPILGARTREQLEDNLGCLDVALSDEHMRRLNEVSAFDLGFPHDFMANPMIRGLMMGDTKVEGAEL